MSNDKKETSDRQTVKSQRFIADVIKERFFDVTLFIACLTGISYAVTLVYQQSYYSAFGIDSSVFELSLSPELILNSAIILAFIMAVGLLVYFYAKIAIKLRFLADRYPYQFFDVGSIFLLIFSTIYITLPHLFVRSIKNDDMLSRVPSQAYLIVFSLLALMIIIMFLIKIVKILKLHHELPLTERYLLASKNMIPLGYVVYSKKFRIIPIWLPAIMISFLLLGTLPYQVARNIANKKSDFTELVTDSSSNLKTLVIGRNSNGLITKNYNVNTNKFESGFMINDTKTLNFRPISIVRQ